MKIERMIEAAATDPGADFVLRMDWKTSAPALVALVKAAHQLGTPHNYENNDDCAGCIAALRFKEALAALPEEWQEP